MMALDIKGFEPTSLIDWPGKISAVIFLPGCNFRCHYCYNPEFILNPQTLKDVDDEKIFSYLETKKKWLDGVVMLGGEPTIHKSFEKIVEMIRNLGLKVAVHTNGTNPKSLKKLIQEGKVDYFAMDIKAPLDKYEKVVDVKVRKDAIKESVKIIRNSIIDYEFRITVVPGLIDKDGIRKIGEWLKGSKRLFIQQFRNEKTLDPEYTKIKPYKIGELMELKKAAEPFFEMVEIRGV